MAVKLEFVTTDPDEIELAHRYWAMSEGGEFLEVLKDLLPFRELKQPAQLKKYVGQFCIAYDLNHMCSCGEPIRASGRTALRKFPGQSNRACDQCQRTQREEQEAKEAAEKAEIEAKLASHRDWMTRKTIDYDALPDDAVLVLRALYASVGPRLWAGRFKHDHCRDLSPYAGNDFVDRLYNQSHLGDDPEGAWRGTYYLRDGKLCIRLEYAHLFLPPDENFGSGEEAFSLLRNRVFADGEALSRLWLDYACDDVTWYLIDQCDLHNQEIYPEEFVKIQDVIRDGLNTYSVAQMWFIMWKVTRDAAALSRRSYYSQQSATATICTKIRKQLELADEKGEARAWNRSSTHIAGTLGKMFNDLFAIDEHSSGAAVLAMFERLSKSKEPANELDELATAFMRDTVDSNNSLAALEAFAEMVRTGLTTEDALIETIQRNSHLFTP
ncbi:hypothetical protein [Pseudomonas viridiflava]|uniref:hypothetical protein n=1 Tax=Pseudomonas viridiflava TaxID=33069 RepID=UPI000F05CED1|nr:hypothetical protein [Pseudomonas viridiflava]